MNTLELDPTAATKIREVTRRAERHLLAKFFTDPAGVQTAVESSGLTSAELLFDDSRYLFEAFQRASTQHGRTDTDALIWMLSESSRLDDVGGKEFLYALAQQATQPEIQQTPATQIVAEVRNLAHMRRLRVQLISGLERTFADTEGDAATMANELASGMIQNNRQRVFGRTVSSCQGSFRAAAQDMIARLNDPTLLPEGSLRIGIPKLDMGLRGVLRRQRVSLLCGPAGVGKTTSVIQWILQVADFLKSQGLAVAEIYQEGGRADWIKRAIELRSVFRTGQTPTPLSLGAAAEDLESLRIFVNDGLWTADELVPHVAQLAQAGTALFVHEAAEHLQVPGNMSINAADPLDGLEYKLHRLKKIAVDNNVAVLMTVSVQAFSINELKGVLRNRESLSDVAMALLPPPPGDKTRDMNSRTLTVFHNHLGDLGSVDMRLQRNLAGALEVVA